MTDIMLLQVERDMAPQWRHLVWTSDCNLLVIAGSSGAVEVCDTVGNQVGGGEDVLDNLILLCRCTILSALGYQLASQAGLTV